MIEILPIRLLTEEDSNIFGSINVTLGKLERAGFPVGTGIVVTPPNFKLKATLEHFDFGTKEVFEQSLALVRKEIEKTPVPEILVKETGKHKEFLVNGEKVKSVKNLWLVLLGIWLEQIKNRLWSKGFYPGITEDLEPQVVVFVKKVEAVGIAHFDPMQDDVEVSVKFGKVHPNDLKKIVEIVQKANKKLLIPHEYRWVSDRGIKLSGIQPYTPSVIPAFAGIELNTSSSQLDPALRRDDGSRSAVKVFFDLSSGFTIEKDVDGIYIASEKIFDLNKPRESFENLVFKLVESAITFPDLPVFLKLADKSEGMGKVRGTLRLLHQKSLFDPLVEALDFVRHKKGLTNIHVVIPFVRGTNELMQIKRELAVKKLMRKNSLQMWMEIAVPENIINLEDYLLGGIDGVVLNLNELIAHLNGFDPTQEDLMFYKNEVEGMIKFLDDGIRLLHKSKVAFIATGNLALHPKILEFLVEKGVYGIVVEKYEAHSAKDLLNQTERRVILRKS